MRPEERYVLEIVADHYSGSFTPGEDPPDAYLKYGTKNVAVEVTRLIEEVVDGSGNARSRYTEDTPGLSIINGLNESHGQYVPSEKYIFLVLPTPINNVREVKRQLGEEIIDMVENCDTKKSIDVANGTISISIYDGDRPSGKKIIGAIDNQNSSSYIGSNAARILHSRILDKETKRKSVDADEYWLAMLAEYWLADNDSYQRAYESLSIGHGFDKLLIVRDNRTVYELKLR